MASHRLASFHTNAAAPPARVTSLLGETRARSRRQSQPVITRGEMVGAQKQNSMRLCVATM